MKTSLETILQECTVRVMTPSVNNWWGTGFLVAPELVLTCNHVISGDADRVAILGTCTQIQWQNQEKSIKAEVIQALANPFDLALLQLSVPPTASSPCVYLDEELKTRDPLYLFGYPDDTPEGVPVISTCEGLTGESPPRIKFAYGQVRPGISGSPLLNQRTKKVCGIVKFTRGSESDLGGGAISTATILSQFPELVKLQQRFHAKDVRWTKFLEPISLPENIPRSGVKKFVGRDLKLEELHQALEEKGGVEICQIEGMGGVGKTELAIQYANEHGRRRLDYPGGICWIDARSEDAGIQIVNFAVNRLKLKFDEALSLKSKVDYCWQEWNRDGNVLIIFDDVTQFTQIEPYQPPQNSRFFVLITTRKRLGASFVSVPLDKLDRAASIDLLKSLIGNDRVERELVTADQLCAWLGDLPLGLDLVGRYLAQNEDRSLERLLIQLRDKDSLRHGSMQPTDPTMSARRGVGAAFDLSWDELNFPAKKLGFILSLFDLGTIPLSLVERAINTSILSHPTNLLLEDIRVDLSNGIAESTLVTELLNLNLIRRVDRETYSLHELIREFFQSKFDEEELQAAELQRQFSAGMLGIAQQLLESSNFSVPNVRTLLNFLLRVPKVEQTDTTLINFLDLLSHYYSFQQYIYDIGYLESAILKLENAKTYLEQLEVPNEKAKVLVGKLLGHAYYANPGQHRLQAIENMLRAREMANRAAQADLTHADHELWLWYQIFLLDHVHNQLSKLPEPVLNLTAEELEVEIAELLPTSLENIDAPPESEDILPSVLRAAHYWGHRGNQVTAQLQRLLLNSLLTVEPAEIESLSEQGIRYYSLAATLRAANFRLSFPEEFQQHLAVNLADVPNLPEWLLSWNPTTTSIEFEHFTSASQAVGDIAHQCRGLATVQLWKYLYEICRGLESALLNEARTVLEIASRLWEEAKALLAPSEQVIKYYIWMASSEMMLLLLERYNSDEQFPTRAEIEAEVSVKMDELEDQYGLVYEWAKNQILRLVTEFHDLLSNLKRSS